MPHTSFNCHCGKLLTADDRLIGRPVTYPHCQRRIPVPDPNAPAEPDFELPPVQLDAPQELAPPHQLNFTTTAIVCGVIAAAVVYFSAAMTDREVERSRAAIRQNVDELLDRTQNETDSLLRRAPPPPARPAAAQYPVRNLSIQRESGYIRVIGEVQNDSHRTHELASFTLAAYGDSGQLLDTSAVVIPNFAAGSVRPFDAYLLAPSARGIRRCKLIFEAAL